VVRGDAIHVYGLLSDAAKKVPAPDNDADFTSQPVDVCDFGSYFVNKYRIDAETCAPCEGLPRDLEQDSFVHVRTSIACGTKERPAWVGKPFRINTGYLFQALPTITLSGPMRVINIVDPQVKAVQIRS
jgi:hypothetical protein